jgi:hypothetical protein
MICELFQSLECQSPIIVIHARFIATRVEGAARIISLIFDAVVVANVLAEVVFTLEAIIASVTALRLNVSLAFPPF